MVATGVATETSTEIDTDLSSLLSSIRSVPDPELPGVSIFDLGIVENIAVDHKKVEVSIMPTYSGCPALDAITQDIQHAAKSYPAYTVSVKTVLAPAWTTDRITEQGRAALLALGIAPPNTSADTTISFIACPRCASRTVVQLSEYSATACRALYRCNRCQEVFDYFKRLA